MSGRRSLALLVSCAVAGGGASTALAGNFQGDAQSVALTAAQAKYKALTGSGLAPKPPADKQRGLRSGWQASYLKGTAAAPVEAYAVIYVYASAADAHRAYVNSCKSCVGKVQTQGIEMKFEFKEQKDTSAVVDVAACRNVYVVIVVSGKLEAGALARTAGALAGGIYAKAMAGGMSPCSP